MIDRFVKKFGRKFNFRKSGDKIQKLTKAFLVQSPEKLYEYLNSQWREKWSSFIRYSDVGGRVSHSVQCSDAG